MFCIEQGELTYRLSEHWQVVRAATRRRQHIAAITNEIANNEEDPDAHVMVRSGDVLAEASLWTTWKHRGDLLSASDGHILRLNSKEFANIVEERPEICVVAARYARQCVMELNSQN